MLNSQLMQLSCVRVRACVHVWLLSRKKTVAKQALAMMLVALVWFMTTHYKALLHKPDATHYVHTTDHMLAL